MPAAEAALRAEGLVKRYGARTAVDGVSLRVNRGEVFALLGPNGAGKTTTLSMLCGLLRPDAGRAFVHGRPVDGGSPEVRARVGVCPQEIVVWKELTCLEQLVLAGAMYDLSAHDARGRGEALLAALGLADRAGSRAKALSGGMRRRLNLALALVHDPDVVVLDEPEAGLDPQSRVLVREYVRSLARTRTVLVTTHNIDEAERVADRIAILDAGRLLAEGTAQELKRRAGAPEALEVALAPGADATRAAAAMASAGEVRAVDGALVVHAAGVSARVPAALEALRAAGVEVAEVRVRASTLEDVFIALTGRRLRE